MKGWITSQTADHFRLPLRMQLAEMISPNSKIIEVGCGTGDLFYLVSKTISFGLGLEASQPLVRYGRTKMKKQGIKNIAIRRARFPETLSYVAKFDIGVASLFFSNLSVLSAIDTLNKMVELCDEVLIAEFDSPKRIKTNRGIADSVLPFDKEKKKAFWKNGGVEGLVKCCGVKVISKVQGPYEGLFVYTVTRVAPTISEMDEAGEQKPVFA